MKTARSIEDSIFVTKEKQIPTGTNQQSTSRREDIVPRAQAEEKILFHTQNGRAFCKYRAFQQMFVYTLQNLDRHPYFTKKKYRQPY
jgi:hypothetical protein